MAQQTTPDAFSITVQQQITFKQLADLLVGAFEGGSNYWIDYVELKKPNEIKFVYDEQHMYAHYTYPFNEGGAVIIFPEDDGEKSYELNLETLKRGTELFIKRKDYADLVSGNDDASTADVFLQLCLFGEVRYS